MDSKAGIEMTSEKVIWLIILVALIVVVGFIMYRDTIFDTANSMLSRYLP